MVIASAICPADVLVGDRQIDLGSDRSLVEGVSGVVERLLYRVARRQVGPVDPEGEMHEHNESAGRAGGRGNSSVSGGTTGPDEWVATRDALLDVADD
jgi:hypothetical protein